MSGDLGVGSTMPTTASHAHTASATTSTTAGHIGMFPVCTCTCTSCTILNFYTRCTQLRYIGVIYLGFTSSMGPDSLAQWLRQEYGADYPEDVEKLCSECLLVSSKL